MSNKKRLNNVRGASCTRDNNQTDHALDGGDKEQLTIGDDVVIINAFVDFNVKSSSPGELVVLISDSIDKDVAFPVPEKEDTEEMIAETDEGLFFGWSEGPNHPPADEPPRTDTEQIIHASAGNIQRVPMYSHVVKKRQNERESASVLSVQYNSTYPTTIPTRAEFAQKIIDRYVNGPLGTDQNSYWVHKRNRSQIDWERYRPYTECEVALVQTSIFTWSVKPVCRISEHQTKFEDV